MDDLSSQSQLNQMKKLGGMKGVLAMLPGVGKIKNQLDAAGMDDRVLTRQEAIISSMTKKERVDPDVINGSRRKRIAAGAGVDVSEVNKLLKMHRQMADMMKEDGQGRSHALQMPGPGTCPVVFRPRNISRSALIFSTVTNKGKRNMALRIRLARGGSKKRPHYNVMIADLAFSARWPLHREDRLPPIPLLPSDHPDRLKLDLDKAKAWIAKGTRWRRTGCTRCLAKAGPG